MGGWVANPRRDHPSRQESVDRRPVAVHRDHRQGAGWSWEHSRVERKSWHV